MEESAARLFFDAENVVGESLVWDDRRQRLVWVDIVSRQIHRLDPATLHHEAWTTPDLVTSVGLRQDGGAVVGLRHHVARWSFDGGPFLPLAQIVRAGATERLNEGKVAPDGSFWVGTMENNIAADGSPMPIERYSGRLYRVDACGQAALLCEDLFGITNTLAWTDDGRCVSADTLENVIYAYHWDRSQQQQLIRRDVLLAGLGRGVPDGSCLDAEGCLWNCRAGGGCIVRIAPNGTVVETVELPCGMPTSCAFGGPDLKTLFITSARFGLRPDELAGRSLEGGLFALRPGVAGRVEHRFG